MTPGQWEEIKDRFHEALQQPAEMRLSFLACTCSDEIVRLEVERLLTQSARAGDFLSRPAIAAFAPLMAGSSAIETVLEKSALSGAKLAAGQALGRYQIVSELGSGGMGVVYRAHDTLLRRSVAVKLLLDEHAGDETALKRFRSEAHALSALSHPNICTVHDIGKVEGRTFIVMEFIAGVRLDELLRDKSLPLRDALRCAVQIASGLASAHAAGIIHRDLKPGNIMITPDGDIKLLDFGVAKLTPAANDADSNESLLTGEGTIVGTTAYMSPEQAEAGNIDVRSDIFSFGAVLFEMTTGQRAFGEKNRLATLSAILTTDPPPVSVISRAAPKELDEVVARCLRKDPAQRFQNATDVTLSLTKIREQMELGISAPRAARISASSWISKSRLLIPVLLVLVIMAAAWAVFGLRGTRDSAPTVPAEKRIAVLPFNIVGNNEEVRALADGLVESLTSKLSQIEDFQGVLTVVPANEIRSRKIGNIEAARRIYGADFVITGSGQLWNNQIQFTLNLVDAATIHQIASRTFTFDAGRPITLLEEGVTGAVQLLELKMSLKVGKLSKAEATSQPGAEAEYLKGIGYLARYDLTGNIDRAIQSLTQATRLDPRYAQAFAGLGHAHWLKAQTKDEPKEKELALESVRESIRLDPNLAEGHLRLGDIYYHTGQTAEAILEIQTALRITPVDVEARELLGDIYVRTKQYGLAEGAYREAVQRKPDDWFTHLKLGLFYVSRNQNALARKEYEEGLLLTPDNEILHRNLADVDVLEGYFQKASDDLVNSLRFEKNVRTYSLLGVTYYYQRRYNEAVDAIKSGLELNPNHYPAVGNLGIVYQHLPGHGTLAREALLKAIKLAEQALEVTRSNTRIHANVAEYWARLGNRKNALDQLELIPEAERNSVADEFILVYELTGNRKQALQTLQALPPGNNLLEDLRHDPDLQSLWSDPALKQYR